MPKHVLYVFEHVLEANGKPRWQVVMISPRGLVVGWGRVKAQSVGLAVLSSCLSRSAPRAPPAAAAGSTPAPPACDAAQTAPSGAGPHGC